MSRSRTNPVVAVFGSSEPHPGSAAYRDAHTVGRLLGEAGFTVMNGGYGGVMEASARGAHAAGARAIGVTVASFTFRQGPNRFIDEEIREPDLFARTRRLIEEAAGFIILPGGSGTLAELTFLWALRKGDLLGPKPIVIVGADLRRTVHELRRLGMLGEAETAGMIAADGPEDAVVALRRVIRPERRPSG